jgi:actin-like ATPase involved in cell morphogenesis
MCACGLDVGTCFLVCARNSPQDESADTEVNSIRDAFLDIEAEPSYLNMLKMSNVSYIQEKDLIYIVGDAAMNMANLFKREARRPLSKGIISAGELDAEKILLILLKNIIKEPKVDEETVYYSVPAKPVDRDTDIVYHEAMFKKLIESMGFKATAMNEAAAIVYANCAAEGFTALASSFGAGMVNTSLVYQTMVGMSFSLSQSGDWIDESAARAVGTTATRIMSVKERGVDLLDPAKGDPKYLREREAIAVYYRNLIHRVIDTIKKEFKKDQSSIELPDSIPWIISGGTSKAINFLEFFKQEFAKVSDNFPINISEVRMASDPLNDVAKGLLIAAMND